MARLIKKSASVAPPTANDEQVGGDHYRMPAGTPEHWDIVIMHGLNYMEGQITRYVFRCRKKNGIEDLYKARHYIDKYIEMIKEGKVECSPEKE